MEFIRKLQINSVIGVLKMLAVVTMTLMLLTVAEAQTNSTVMTAMNTTMSGGGMMSNMTTAQGNMMTSTMMTTKVTERSSGVTSLPAVLVLAATQVVCYMINTR